MRKCSFIFLLFLIITSCGKDNVSTTPDNSNTINGSITGKVTINGTSYPTVMIGLQTWTSANYNGPGGVNYNNSTDNDAAYGKLYTYAEAKAITLPAGWRLPSETEFIDLIQSIDPSINPLKSPRLLSEINTSKFMSKTGWTRSTGNTFLGSNTTGFNAYPAGLYYNYPTTGFKNIGLRTDFWIATYPNSSYSIYEHLDSDKNVFSLMKSAEYPDSRASIRFVKDK